MSKFALNNKTIHNCIISDGVCNIVFSHTLQSIEGLSEAVDIYNSLINDGIIKDTKLILENINGDVLNQMTREVLKIYIKTELDKTIVVSYVLSLNVGVLETVTQSPYSCSFSAYLN